VEGERGVEADREPDEEEKLKALEFVDEEDEEEDEVDEEPVKVEEEEEEGAEYEGRGAQGNCKIKSTRILIS
jgi:hypothetical protein